MGPYHPAGLLASLRRHSYISALGFVIVLASPTPTLLFADTDPASSLAAVPGVVYAPDCNDPDGPLPTWVCREAPHSLLPPGYPYYVGHDEPEMQLYSTTPGSGNNVQWKITLPAADPTPTQDGTKVANRELYPTFWFSMALCDPQSTPFGPCTPNSDTNTSAAGSAILELQLYPPGSGCPGDNSKWCAALTIDELTTNCGEPITAANITTDGTTSGPRLLMSASDKILITIKDTPAGLTTILDDLTSGQTGSMVASGANGFTQTIESTHAVDPSATCATSPFSYHPEYLTALPGNNGSWINANINLSFEIGHGQVCGDAACTIKPDSDADDTGCGTVLGVGICTGQDSDLDGLSYIADWPDGTANHPSSVIIGNALDDGMGPLSFSNGSYQAAYGTILFQPNGNAAKAPFFPFFSQAGTGGSCVFNFGNDIPGTTTKDFGKGAQYGTTITNPCTGAPIAQCQNVTVPTDPNVCTASSASIDNGSFDSDGDPLTLAQSPAAPYSLGTTAVGLTVTDSESLSASCTASVTVVDRQLPSIACPSPTAECTGPGGAVVTFSAIVSDNCPGVQDLGCSPPSGSTFPLGTTPFTCNAKDNSGNPNSCSSNVSVQDTTGPTISLVSADPGILWSPNHKFVPVSITVAATDICDPSPRCTVVSVTSNEPVLAGESGHTDPDWVLSDPGPKVSPASLGVQLRAERAGGGNGRVYTINVSCRDASGNTTAGKTTVLVPHDQSK
jgi:HYR domain-containing protein